MKKELKHSVLAVMLFTLSGCGNKAPSEAAEKQMTPSVESDSLLPVALPRVSSDTLIFNETYREDDMITNEYLVEELKPIRKNFKRINSMEKWTSSDTLELWESLEGGEAEYFYSGNTLEKIITRHFGETYQILIEYYLLDGKLSFVFEKNYKYNRPLYYDSIAMKENNDDQVWDFDKSAIMEDRSYFNNGKLIHQINNQDCGSPFTDEYLNEEQKRILSNYNKLIELKKMHSQK